MIPQQQQQATAGMLATARTPALSKEHKQEKEQPRKQKRQQQQDLCGKAIKVAGNEARNMAVNVAMIQKNSVAVKGPQMAVVFARSGSECLQGSGNAAGRPFLLGRLGQVGRLGRLGLLGRLGRLCPPLLPQLWAPL
jgi:hypothetical protein